MPSVRFSRDRRGYESTFLVAGHRGRGGEREETRVLYWFRTPPHLKVGRAAFDEDAIRSLEDGHPEVDFDWRQILAAKAPPSEPQEDGRSSRFHGRRPGDSPPRPQPSVRQAPPSAKPPNDPERGVVSVSARAPAEPSSPEPADVPVAVAPPLFRPEPDPIPEPDVPVRRFVRVFDAGPAEEPPHHLSDPSASERALGSEQLGRLRGQYAAALARIGRRVTDPRQSEALRAVAERANPDAWVTADDVKAGLSSLDAVYAELAQAVGRRRRRRRPQTAQTAESRPGHAHTRDVPAPAETAENDSGDEPLDSDDD